MLVVNVFSVSDLAIRSWESNFLRLMIKFSRRKFRSFLWNQNEMLLCEIVQAVTLIFKDIFV